MIAAGIMSGTSLDGIDVALVDIDGVGLDTTCRLISFYTFPMPLNTKKHIMRACLDKATTSQLSSLHSELGYLFAHSVQEALKRAHIASKDLRFIASHGQTVWHAPSSHEIDSCAYSSTLQLGNSAIIAWECQTTVVSDFRSMDMAAGGQGAPLVPYSELVLYAKDSTNRALVNIGGISNITALKAKAQIDDVFAFDCGPGNMMIDEACRVFFGCEFDEGGQLAARGNLNPQLWQRLCNNKFYEQNPPKSTGREMFGAQYTRSLLRQCNILDATDAPLKSECAYDVLYTFTHYSAFCIAEAYKHFVKPHFAQQPCKDQLIVSGGGAHNKTLMSMLDNMLPGVMVCSQHDLGYSSDAKEAIAFALMGNETLHGRASNVPRVTGAACPVVLGNVTPCPIPTNSGVLDVL